MPEVARSLRRHWPGASPVERVIIHIGSDKAGSTAIQESLWTNRAWYLERGVHIPEAGVFRGGSWPLLRDRRPEVIDELVAESVECPTVVMTWEGVHYYGAAERRWLRRLLAQVFPVAEPTFLYYVRNQVDLLQSGLLQRVKSLERPPATVRELNAPLQQIPARSRRLLDQKHRRFSQVISRWRSAFPDARFDVRLFDRDRLVGGDVVDDFHDAVGIGGHPGFRRPERPANPSLSVEAAIALEQLLPAAADDDDRRRLVDTALAFPLGSGSFLHDDTRDGITKNYRADNATLVDAFPRCAGIEVPRSVARPDIDAAAVAECVRFLDRQRSYPTLLGGGVGGRDLALLNLVEGWEAPDDDGAWVTDRRSLLRFRLWSPRVNGYTVGVALKLSGRYEPTRASTDEIIVNGRSHGRHDLRSGPIVVDIADLDHTLDIEIELVHEPTGSTSARAFQLRALRFEPRTERGPAGIG